MFDKVPNTKGSFQIWYAKTPLGRKRIKAAKEGQEEEAAGKRDKGKKGGKKKK